MYLSKYIINAYLNLIENIIYFMYDNHCKDIDDMIDFLQKYKKHIVENKNEFIENKYHNCFLLINNYIYCLKDKLSHVLSFNSDLIKNINIEKEVNEYIEYDSILKENYPLLLACLLYN